MVHMELMQRKQKSLRNYDYSNPGAYFITICTKRRENLFWSDAKKTDCSPVDVPLTKLGIYVQQAVCEIPKRYPAITVDHAVIMPNHIHLLLQIHTDVDGRPMAAPTISTVINQIKGTVSKKAGFSVWQKGFYDHVIRGETDYEEIWNYIERNPGKWLEDSLYNL